MVYIFARLSDAQLETAEPAQWSSFRDRNRSDIPFFNTFIDLEDAQTYVVRTATAADTFAVFDYGKYRAAGKSVSLELTCDVSRLLLPDVPVMEYGDTLELLHRIGRDFTVHYTTLKSDSVSWVETEVEETLNFYSLHSVYLPRMIYLPTSVEFRGDRFAEHLYGESDLIRIEEEDVRPVAIGIIPRAYVALRGTERENERERVIEEEVQKYQVTGSAPLNILFRSNATPTAEYFLWEIRQSEDLIAARTDNETRYVFDVSGVYIVTLEVSNRHGCKCEANSDTTRFTVTASESFLAIPNVFTPNGDNINDEFRVSYRSIKSFSCVVFNRWQHQIYASSDPAQGWDGRVNGRPAPEGAYFYIVEAEGTDGVKYKRKGAVNLLRGKK